MTESRQNQERARPGAMATVLRLLKRMAAQDSNDKRKQARTVPLPFQGLPPPGKRHLVLPGVIVLFAALMIIASTDIKTFLGVLGVSVLFVIAISAIVNRLL